MFFQDYSYNTRFILTNTKLHIFRIPKNQSFQRLYRGLEILAFPSKVFLISIVCNGAQKKATKQLHWRFKYLLFIQLKKFVLQLTCKETIKYGSEIYYFQYVTHARTRFVKACGPNQCLTGPDRGKNEVFSIFCLTLSIDISFQLITQNLFYL